jgi:hypothetical protein
MNSPNRFLYVAIIPGILGVLLISNQVVTSIEKEVAAQHKTAAITQEPDLTGINGILDRKISAHITPGAIEENVHTKPFDMEYVRNAPSLETEVIRGWHKIKGAIPTLQKEVIITVCEWWPGYQWRVPVVLTVPEDGARGFVITGQGRGEKADPGIDRLLAGGVGHVRTKISVIESYPDGKKAAAISNALLSRTKDYRYTRFWIWGMTMMRAATAALAEEQYMKPGKIAAYGGSKNGLSPAMALIHDDRFTGIHPNVAPPNESPYLSGDPVLLREVADANHRFFTAFDAGNIQVPFNREWYVFNSYGRTPAAMLKVSMTEDLTEEDVYRCMRQINKVSFVSLHHDRLEDRGCEFLFDLGSHDNVTPALTYLGEKYPEIPVCIHPNGGHGQQGKGLLPFAPANDNQVAFMSNHFFGNRPMMKSPVVRYEKRETSITVEVSFTDSPPADTGKIFWMFDRDPGGSAGYVAFYFKHFKDMNRVNKRSWKAEIELNSTASTVDFFTFHSNTIGNMPAHISCPYTRINLR